MCSIRTHLFCKIYIVCYNEDTKGYMVHMNSKIRSYEVRTFIGSCFC